jgi:tRNA pseudouridine38-40 synthase
VPFCGHLNLCMKNIKLTISYEGTEFNGWQRQPGYRTVQEVLETILEGIVGEKVFCNPSGRTDKGVHAVGQVVNFYSNTYLKPEVIVRALNARLPEDVSAREACEVSQIFDANKDAIRKLYRYVILDSPSRSPFMRRYAFYSKFRLDAEKMHRASRCLVGRHDFHSFETEWPNRLSSIRTITHLNVNRVGEYIWMDAEADGFLYNMVRAIAGTLINIGRDFWPEERMEEILEAENRSYAGPTAPPEGLYLIRVIYDESQSPTVADL